MIHLTGRLICKDDTQAALVRRHLPEHIRLSRAEPGCLTFDVSQTSPLIWDVRESFTDQAGFDAHQARTHASDWCRHSAGIAREYQITKD